MENIEAQSSYHSISHCVLLIQMSRICARLHIEPGSPFVKKKIYLVFRVIAVHDRDMALDDTLDFHCLAECIVIFLICELGS